MRPLLSLLIPFLLTFAAVADDDIETMKVSRSADIAAAKDASKPERVVGEVANGSIELVVDAGRDTPLVEAEFTVGGIDEKDLKRRAELVRLYAERAADQSVVVQPIFPGKMVRGDSVKVRIVVPKCGDSSLKCANGAITVSGTAGKLKVSTRNGAIKVTGHAGSIEANASNGNIEITGAGAEVKATSANGAVEVSLADGNDLPFDIESKTGDVRVEVGAAFDGQVKMHTTTGGISLSDSGRRMRTTHETDHARTVELGAGTGHSEIRTTTGSVRLAVRSK